MATQEKTWNVANRMHSQKDSDNPEVNHIIAGADEIYDDEKGAKQSEINAQTDAALADRYTKEETYSKEQLDALITTPDANYVTVATFADLPQTGEGNTVYRVSSYDGTQVDASKYALYAWNGTSYQMLAVRSAVGEVFDVSEYNSGATYETLTAALAAVPASVQRGGMSIKFILRTNTGTEEEPVYHDEYVQYRLMSTDWSTVITDWQGVDKVPTPDSDNLVRSGGVQNELALGAVYDVSAKNPTAGPNNDGKFESLSALLSDNNLNILIPTAVRKGGMSIKFVHSSDNIYVQYRLMSDEWSITPANWQGVDDKPVAGSKNLVESGGVFAEFDKLNYDFLPLGYGEVPFFLKQDNTWSKSTGAAAGVLLPCEGKQTYTIATNGHSCVFAFLKSNTPANNQQADYATGASRVHFYSDGSQSGSVPSDAKYLYVSIKNNNNNWTPSSVVLDGYDYIPGVLGNIVAIGATAEDTKKDEQLLKTITARSLGKVSIIGDSISTYDGYIPDGYTPFYPAGNHDVNSVDKTWWKMLIDNAPDTSLEVNASYGGSSVTYDASSNRRPDFYERAVADIIGSPDTIFVALGTNDSVNQVALGEYDYDSAIADLSERQFIPAYIKGVKQLLISYPDAKIVLLMFKMGDGYKTVIRNIALHYGLEVIDASIYYIDNVHPETAGMKIIANQVNKVLGLTDVIFGNIEQVTSPMKEDIDSLKERAGEYAYSEDYIQANVDQGNRIISGIKKDGKSVFNKGIEVAGFSDEGVIENAEWLDVVTDKNGRIIEGTKQNGEKFFAKFAPHTKALIKQVAKDGEFYDTMFNIPLLDANFTTKLPFKVYNGSIEDNAVKGTSDAKYVFRVPFEDSWVIRFKFRVTEDLLNQNKRDVTIAKIDNRTVVYCYAIPFTQHKETGTYQGQEYSDNWPTVDGGIVYNHNAINTYTQDRNIGGQAFSVKYVGSGSVVTLANDGTAITLSVDGTDTTYTFANYDNVSELFAAMSSNADLELQYIALDQRTCDELAKFPAISLKGTIHYGGVGGVMGKQEVVDAAPLYLYYAVSDKWHQAEIFKIGDTIYSVCEGNVRSWSDTSVNQELILGGGCGILFKDLMICSNSTLDTEYVNNMVISPVNPYILVFECHGMVDMPAYQTTPATTEDGMSSLNPDSMEFFFTELEKKGYLPVRIEDIAEYYTAGKPLPKRCYVNIFDDTRWHECLDNNIRCVFNRHGATPALAMITNAGGSITHNGQTITKEQAVAITKAVGYSIVSHTKDHRYNGNVKPSDYINVLLGDIYDADDKYVNGSILVYPGGGSTVYLHDTMDFLGFKMGIEIYNNRQTSNVRHNRFMVSRVNIGRIIAADGTSLSPYTDYISDFR